MCVMVVVVIEWVKKGNAYSNWLNWVRNTLLFQASRKKIK